MQIKKSINLDKLLVEADGRLDVETACDFGCSVTDCIEDNDIKNLILDFSKINYVSSIGLRILLELQKKMQGLGSMKLINVQQPVMDVFEMTGFSKILTIQNVLEK